MATASKVFSAYAGFTLYIDMTETSYSIANNTSSMAWELYVRGRDQYASASGVSSYPYNIKIDGSIIASGNLAGYSWSGTTKRTIASGTQEVTHNTDGTKSITFSGYFSGHSSLGNATADGSMNLTTIPRYAVINSFSATVDSPTTISCSWSTDKNCSAVYYSINDGSSWSSSVGSGTSGSFTISGLTANTTYPIKLKVTSSDSGLDTISSTLSRTTWALSTASFSNFNLGDNFTVNISRASSNMTHTVDIYCKNPSSGSYTLIKQYTNVETTLTASFTSGELNTIYAMVPNRNDVSIQVAPTTFIGTTNYGYTFSSAQTCYVVNANPTFTTFTYADTNASTLALTGDSQTLIKGHSDVTVTITSANKAVAQKGATMSTYSLLIGSQSSSVAYSSSSTVTATIADITNNVIVVRAIDSRGNYTDATLTATGYHDYTSPTIISGTATRTDNIEKETTLAYNGGFYNYSFGSVTNTVSATYEYKKTTDSSYTSGSTTLTPTASGQTYSDSTLIAGDDGATGFLQTYSYNIKITVTDSLSSTTYNLLLNSGKPSLSISQGGISVNGIYDDLLDDGLQVSGKIYLNGAEFTGGGSGTTVHSSLTNLDYASAGHTGFQPAGDYVVDANYVHTDNNFTDTLETKLNGIEAEANKYVLPTASTTVLGGVKLSDFIGLDASSKLNPNLHIYKWDGKSGVTTPSNIALFQTIYDDYMAGNDVAILATASGYKQLMFVYSVSSTDFKFMSDKGTITTYNSTSVSTVTYTSSYCSATLSSGTVTAIGAIGTTETIGDNKYLRTDRNYATPYTPLYNGSPATKKYVDDRTVTKATGAEVNTGTDDAKFVTSKAVEDSNLIRSVGDTIKNVVSITKADYDALATKDANTLYNITDDADYSIGVINNLTSTSTVDALSAYQGKILKEQIDNGWQPIIETWTYASATTFTISGDKTSTYSKGTRVKWTQTTVKYGVVKSSTYSSPNTTVTLFSNNNYSITNATILSNYISYNVNPIGFPLYFNYTPTVTASGGTAPTYSSVDGRFFVCGSYIDVVIDLSNSTGGTAGNGAVLLTVGIPAVPTHSVLGNGAVYEAGGSVDMVIARNGYDVIYFHGTNGNKLANDQSSAERYMYFKLNYMY